MWLEVCRRLRIPALLIGSLHLFTKQNDRSVSRLPAVDLSVLFASWAMFSGSVYLIRMFFL
jgi:hypothetical protein